MLPRLVTRQRLGSNLSLNPKTYTFDPEPLKSKAASCLSCLALLVGLGAMLQWVLLIRMSYYFQAGALI